MSYSDYGSYNWEKVNGTWFYRPEFEDRSLITPQSERILESIYGLKFDAVLQSQINEGKHKELPFSIVHTHHSVLGDLKHFAVVSYKGTPTVLWQGKEIDQINFDDVSDEVWDSSTNSSKKKENFVPKVIDITKENCRVKVLIDTSFNYWSVAYVKNNDKEFMGMCGYGLGNHWWLNEDGTENYPENPLQRSPKPWLREKECLERAVGLLNIL